MKPRKIVVHNKTYFWVIGSQMIMEPFQEVTKVSIWPEENKKAVLRLEFSRGYLVAKEQKTWCVNDSSGTARSFSNTAAKTFINFNEPASIAALVRYFLQNGWEPLTAKKPFVINDAINCLDVIATQLYDHEL